MAKIVLPSISSGYATTVQINQAFEQLEAELQNNVLYRNNPVGEPNYLQQELDCNGNDLLNVGTINGISADALTDLTSYVAQAEVSAVASATSASTAASSAVSAVGSAAAAAVSAGEASAYASVGFNVASTIYDFGSITDAVLTFTTDYGSVV